MHPNSVHLYSTLKIKNSTAKKKCLTFKWRPSQSNIVHWSLALWNTKQYEYKLMKTKDNIVCLMTSKILCLYRSFQLLALPLLDKSSTSKKYRLRLIKVLVW